MSPSAEFITGTAFAAIMVVIGLGAIWMVRWQTYFLLRHQNRDLEHGRTLTGASIHQVESIELASLTQPSTGLLNANEDAGLDVDGNSSAITDGRSTTSVDFGQNPGAGILGNYPSTKKGPSVLQSGTPSYGLTRNQSTSSDGTVDNRPIFAGLSTISSAALPEDVVKTVASTRPHLGPLRMCNDKQEV